MWNIPSSSEHAGITVDLFSDLDNTLIYSHRTELPPDKVAVEYLNGQAQSFMTARALWFLQNASWARLIPVTTRSVEQFRRVFVFERTLPCRYALVCNGGELLIDGESDPQWLRETRQLAAQELAALPEAADAMRAITPERIHAPSDLMVYAKCGDPVQAAKILRTRVDLTRLNVLHDSRKVYCIPHSINKGSALERFQKRFPTRFIVAAGDSEFDIPLLNAADLAVFPRQLEAKIHCPRKVVVDSGEVLSDGLCSILEALKADQTK